MDAPSLNQDLGLYAQFHTISRFHGGNQPCILRNKRDFCLTFLEL